jgi:hypothetical protein
LLASGNRNPAVVSPSDGGTPRPVLQQRAVNAPDRVNALDVHWLSTMHLPIISNHTPDAATAAELECKSLSQPGLSNPEVAHDSKLPLKGRVCIAILDVLITIFYDVTALVIEQC